MMAGYFHGLSASTGSAHPWSYRCRSCVLFTVLLGVFHRAQSPYKPLRRRAAYVDHDLGDRRVRTLLQNLRDISLHRRSSQSRIRMRRWAFSGKTVKLGAMIYDAGHVRHAHPHRDPCSGAGVPHPQDEDRHGDARGFASDFETAQLMGIKINRVISVTFADRLAAGRASARCCISSNYASVRPLIGAMPGLKAFVAAVFGGIGSIPGAVIGAFLIGICESFIKGSALLPSFQRRVYVCAADRRCCSSSPRGLFGEKHERESVGEHDDKRSKKRSDPPRLLCWRVIIVLRLRCIEKTQVTSMFWSRCCRKRRDLCAACGVHEPAQRLHGAVFARSGGLYARSARIPTRFSTIPAASARRRVPVFTAVLLASDLPSAGAGALLAARRCRGALRVRSIGLPVPAAQERLSRHCDARLCRDSSALVAVQSASRTDITNGSIIGLTKIPGFSSYYGIFIVAAVCIALIVLLINSSYGRAFKAIRDDEIAAEAMGINLAKHKQMQRLSSARSSRASAARCWQCSRRSRLQANASPSPMTYEILLIVVIGGMGSVTGSRYCGVSRSSRAANGGCAFWTTQTYHRRYSACRCCEPASAWSCSQRRSSWWSCCSSARGIMGDNGVRGTHLRCAATSSFGGKKAAAPEAKTMSESMLRMENVTMQFGGVVAVNNLSLDVNKGEIVALIGPNGAGKTTAFNCITGVYQPTNGKVLL